MKRTIILLLLALLCVASAQEHKNETKGFALTPAEGWTVKADEQAFGTNLTVKAPGEDPYSPSIQVAVWPGERTIKDYYEQQKTTLQGTAQNLTYEDAELGGKKAGSFSYTVKDSLKTRSVYLPANGMMYVVSHTARLKEFDKYADEFKQMYGSFKVLTK